MKIGRRNVLVAGVAAIAAGAVLVVRAFGGRKLTAAEKSACELTVEATSGPFHVTGAPELAGGDLNPTKLPGNLIEVSGRVFLGLDDTKPAAGAEVEIWHADSDGAYHPNGNGPSTDYKPEEVALRGFVKADAEGRYRFSSIYPGEYTGRARHFHFKIRAPGRPELTTQLIVPAKPGDSLTFDSDDIAEGLPDCQLLAVDETAAPANATFDFRV
jgi:protocatechuate 3,4-dioxygenase beta subunit